MSRNFGGRGLDVRTRFLGVIVAACFLLLGGAFSGIVSILAAEAGEPVISMDSAPLEPDFLSKDVRGSRDVSVSGDLREVPVDLSSREKVLSIDVEGLDQVVKEHVLSAVSTKVGDSLSEMRLTKDVDAIFDLGFFANVDYRIVDEDEGVRVVFTVEENPVVEEVRFFGNTVYSSKVLSDICFTQPGMIFNRQFFRNDLQRIKEKYQQAGYVMARISDVRIEGAIVNVYVVEPRIEKIILQGNKRTKSHVIKRQISIKEGDLFNAVKLRHTLGRLQGLGYFGDVNVGFEEGENPGKVIIVLTVEETKTGRFGITMGYGSQSGWGGGLNYNDSNWQGLGHNVGIGFELGDREQYWFNYEQPYMGYRDYAWRLGAYKRTWKNLSRYIGGKERYKYDETRKGTYFGLGRKFSEDSKLSWFLLADWHDVDTKLDSGDIYITDAKGNQRYMEDQNGRNFSLALTLQRNNMDPYLSYNKGDVQAIHIEKGFDSLGGDWDYWKYWAEVRWYLPLDFISKFIERTVKFTDEPPLFAMRMRAGTSGGGYIPWGEQYVIGGDTTMRGLKDEYFRGNRMFLGNFEIRIPIQKSFSIVGFYDLGKAWNTYLGEKFDLGDLENSYGFGIRVKTPMGNMRLDIAQGKEENRVHFGFGEMF